ncbi:MAG: hypothetical protein HXS46_05025 [Theionarchaea archaeon]|nr:MAG: hypothetical protein AYK18_10835 [Theionarchaea archaeon DG-70]MBU7010030.1 hypothetical protein [Theionarchaea archaeon]
MIRTIIGLAVVIGLALLWLFLIKFLWKYLMPRLFPGLVEKGYIASEIGWWPALALTIVSIMVMIIMR